VSTVTILIPVHDPNREYENLIHNALESISKQDLQPVEVLIVANHEMNYLDETFESFGHVLNLRILKSDAQSAPENINFGVNQADSRFVRLLFQDDYLSGSKSLSYSVSPLESGKGKWSVIGSVGVDLLSGRIYKSVIPKFTEKLSSGKNLIGAPSVVCFEKDTYVPMNIDLKFMFDCDWYLRMAHRFGPPVEVQEFGVGIGIHEGQATNWAQNLLSFEKRTVKKHHRKKFFGENCLCVSSNAPA
jgi:glycosyltransferase involved in cell wall biosynthesis